MTSKIELRRTRDFSEKINISFEFTRQNLLPLSKALIYISGPFILLQGFFSGLYQNETLGRVTLGSMEMYDGSFNSFLWLGIAYVFIFLGYVSSLIVVYEYLRIYESRTNNDPIEVSEVWKGIKENYFSMVGALLIMFIMSLLGLILLVIPAIYLAVVFSLIPPIMIIEKLNFSDALSRSFRLITDKWWSTFGLIFVMSIIIAFMAMIFSIPQLIFTSLMAVHGVETINEIPLWQQAGMIISSVIYSFGAGILQSLVFLAVAFQLYNLIERKEAKGLMSKLEAFGKVETKTSESTNETF